MNLIVDHHQRARFVSFKVWHRHDERAGDDQDV
jgi:hypothetical protein